MLDSLKTNSLCWLLFTLSAVLTFAKPETDNKSCILSFKNGDRVHAEYLSWTKNRITVKSSHFTEELSFSMKLLSSVQLNPSLSTENQSDHQATITIVSSPPNETVKKIKETIVGKVVNYTEESVTIKPAFTKALTIPHSSIERINIENLSDILYSHTANLSDWNEHDDSDIWKGKGNTISSSGSGRLSRNVNLNEKTHISFKLNSPTKNLNLWLYADDEEGGVPQNYYDLRINSNSFYLQKIQKGNFVRLKKVIPQVRPIPTNRIKYDIYTDLTKGEFNIFTDGVLSTTYIDNDAKKCSGKYLNLISQSYPQSIENLTIKKWNGILSKIEQRGVGKIHSSGRQIYLLNGDVIKGAILGVENSHLLIKTDFATFKTPLKKVLNLETHDLKPIENTIESNDLILITENNDKIFVRSISSNGHSLRVLHYLWGEIEIDLRAISQINYVR